MTKTEHPHHPKQSSKQKRCGYVLFIGLPNAGKSTLLNACIAQKIVGVSRKPQTTRDVILGIRTVEESQFLFYDSPGLNRVSGRAEGAAPVRKQLNGAFNSRALAMAASCHVLCYLVAAQKGFTDEDFFFLEALAQRAGEQTSLLLLFTQKDRLTKSVLAETLAAFKANYAEKLAASSFPQIVALPAPQFISAKYKEDIQAFLQQISLLLPEQEWLHDEDALTDKSTNFVIAEHIREQLFRELGQEIPFGCAVEVEAFEELPGLVRIGAVVTVDKDSHKPIVIGHRGTTLACIGKQARESLEIFFAKKVFLKLFVKVMPRGEWEKTIL